MSAIRFSCQPLVEIGGRARPVLYRIVKIYAAHGTTDFIVCLGYEGYVIKEFFASNALHMSDVTFDLGSRSVTRHRHEAEAHAHAGRHLPADGGDRLARKVQCHAPAHIATCATGSGPCSWIDFMVQIEGIRREAA
jgi:hypothetical protein